MTGFAFFDLGDWFSANSSQTATDRADLDDERGWWKSPPAGGSAPV